MADENKEKEIRKKFSKIYIDITNENNLKKDDKTCKKYLSVEEFEIIIEKIHNFTDLICFEFSGDPLLNVNLEEFLKLCEKYDLKVNITTNGIFLDKFKDVIKKSNSIRIINILLYSVENNKEIDIDKYLEFIFKVSEEIINDANNPNLKISYRLLYDKDILNSNFNKKVFSFIEKFYKLKKISKRAKKEKFIELSNKTFLNQDSQFIMPRIDGKVLNENGKCFALRNSIGILIDGTIVPCNLDLDGNINLGNIFKVLSLDEVLNSYKVENIIDGFKNNILKENLCKRCGFICRFGKNDKE